MQREKIELCPSIGLASYNSELQSDDNSQNPLPSNAYLGFNKNTKEFEVFNDVGWQKLGPSKPVYQGKIVFPCDVIEGSTAMSGY